MKDGRVYNVEGAVDVSNTCADDQTVGQGNEHPICRGQQQQYAFCPILWSI